MIIKTLMIIAACLVIGAIAGGILIKEIKKAIKKDENNEI